MKARRTLTWVAVAALGVGLTTSMTITTTLLSQQPIALSSEPLSAGNALVPKAAPGAAAQVETVARRHKTAKRHHRVTTKPESHASPRLVSPAASPAAPPSAVTRASNPILTPSVAHTTTARVPSDRSGDKGTNDGGRDQSGSGSGGSDQRGADD